MTGLVALVWAWLGVALILGTAMLRLGVRGWTTLSVGLTPMEWVVLGGLTVALVYWEGVRALRRRWVPRALARAQRLDSDTAFWLKVGAPFYAMSLIGGPTAVVVRAWLGTTAIVAAVLIVRLLPHPWRGIVDFAVALALATGLGALVEALPAALASMRGSHGWSMPVSGAALDAPDSANPARSGD